MAIKMTHKGIRPEDVLFTGTCTHCFSQYEASLSDLKVRKDSLDIDNYYSVNDQHYANCQVCGKDVYFTRKRNALPTTVPKSPPPPPMRRGDGKLEELTVWQLNGGM